MSTGMIGIGMTGIAAAQAGLLATEHNVVNASTPGYSRQRVVLATNIAVNTGAGAIGQGVHVQTIERMYDSYLGNQVNTATSKLSEISTYYTQISQIDNLLADTSAGLTPALQEFFSGVQEVSSNPGLISARQSMISTAQTLVARFASLNERLTALDAEVNGKITDAVKSINTYAEQIADLNQRIVISEGAYAQPSNDLLDQRDQLVLELNELIQVKTSSNSDGSYNVFVGSGQQLVVGNRAMTMTARAAMSDNSRIVVGLETASGGSIELPENLIVGGELGGLVDFRSETLDRAQSELGRIAASVALTVNAQSALGQDLLGQANGDAGFEGNFFATSGLVSVAKANSLNDLSGSPVISVTLVAPEFGPEVATGNFYTNLKASDYRLDNVGGGNYTVTRLSDGVELLSAPDTLANISTYLAQNEGFSVSLSGLDANGNSYVLQPTKHVAETLAVNPVVAADSRLVAAAAPFRTASGSSNTGSASISAGKMVGGTAAFSTATSLPVTLSYGAPVSPSTVGTLSFSGAGAPATVLVKRQGAAEVSEAVPIAYSQGMVVSFNGMSFQMNGQPSHGDTFTLTRNTAASTDGRNALALGLLQTQNTVAGGAATFQTAYAEMVANNGIKTRELRVMGEAQQAVLDQAQENRDALSGVNLDEEAANMIRFQQAYQASAKLLEIGKSLFDTLIQIG